MSDRPEDTIDGEPAHMWKYWSRKYSKTYALREYFPETLAADPRLQAALSQIQNAEAAIEAVFTERAEREEE